MASLEVTSLLLAVKISQKTTHHLEGDGQGTASVWVGIVRGELGTAPGRSDSLEQ